MPNPNPRNLIEGKAALIVIDIQANSFMEEEKDHAIPSMNGYAERMLEARKLIDQARASNIPVVFIKEAHRADLIDFGRELDGDETIHCVEGDAGTELAYEQMDIRPTDYTITKRRYSSFFGTDLEILLKGLKAETLLLCGGLTDVCVHYTFVDGHQSDYFCRVVEDAVAGSSDDAHAYALRAMEYLQTGAVRRLDETLDAMKLYKR